jgi:hypothetical protein
VRVHILGKKIRPFWPFLDGLHVIYDKQTGRIIHTHRRFNVDDNAYSECEPEEVMDLIRSDDFSLRQATDNDPKNLDIIVTTDLPEDGSFEHGFLVDTKSKTIIEMPKIALSSEKTELEGDGKDITVIDIKIQDSEGNIVKSYNGTVKVITSRGKLSIKAGLVKLKEGVGTIKLTSVNETVDRVSLVAKCLEGKCGRADLDFEFI